MTISIGTLDRKIWSKDLILSYLYDCLQHNKLAVIDLTPEGSCATELGLYKLLDQFCTTTGFAKQHITIKTANMIERHSYYNIVRDSQSWYEVIEIHKWAKDKVLNFGTTPSKHFANFTSRNNWSRLWIATILHTYFKDKTVQTYHYSKNQDNYNPNNYVGLDDLVRYNCSLVNEASDFLQSCPRTIDLDFLQNLKNCKDSIFQHTNSYYPIQHPSNLNLLQYYSDIFVDIVVEPNVHGQCFLATEKLWRPILARRPFIVLSNQNYLHNLRKLGFKTFNDFWSEDYDHHSENSRILEIQKILEIISTYTTDQLHKILIDMKEILDYNYQIFASLTPQKIQGVFGD